jgi:hypothetical protein
MYKKLTFIVLLLHSMTILAAAPAPLLKVGLYPGFISPNFVSHTNTCTIYNNGKVVVNRHTNFPLELTNPPSPSSFDITETRTLKFRVSDIKKAIAQAAKGTISGNVVVDLGGIEYDAYRGSTVVFLQGDNGRVNNSEWVSRLVTIIDEWCGDISK